MDDITVMLTAMLAGIAGISLLVGGIGIMNIMLVTVSERTKEIGIRKALGAGRGSIMLQFLIESSIISGFGGIIGVLLGIYTSSYISKLLGTRLVINVYVLASAFGFSLLIGLFFGLYPASRASKLKPVDALRFE
jgi:putative ABC transport system permease protein